MGSKLKIKRLWFNKHLKLEMDSLAFPTKDRGLRGGESTTTNTKSKGLATKNFLLCKYFRGLNNQNRVLGPITVFFNKEPPK